MLSSEMATAIAFVTVSEICLFGLGVGLAANAILRLPWSLRAAIVDLALAAAVSVLLAFVFVAIALARGPFDPGLKWMFLASGCAIVMHHVGRRKRRSSKMG